MAANPNGQAMLATIKSASLQEVQQKVVGPTALAFRDIHSRSLLTHAAIRLVPGELPSVAADVCRHLVEVVGLAVDTLGDANQSALFWASRMGNAEVVSTLLELKAAVDTVDSNRQTSLFYAAAWGQAAAVELLLGSAADASHQDMNGETALFYATKLPKQDVPIEAHVNCVKYLCQAKVGGGANLVRLKRTKLAQTVLFCVARIGVVEYCSALLDVAHAAVDDIDMNGQTALFYAAATLGCGAMVAALLERKASANVLDRNSDTPLHYAAKQQNAEACRLLLEVGGADPCAKNARSMSPNAMVLDGNWKNRPPELVKLFQQYGPAKRPSNNTSDLQSSAKRLKGRGFGNGRGRGKFGSASTAPVAAAAVVNASTEGGNAVTSTGDGADSDDACSNAANKSVLALAYHPVRTCSLLGDMAKNTSEGTDEVEEDASKGRLYKLLELAYRGGSSEVEALLSSDDKCFDAIGPHGRNAYFYLAMRQAHEDSISRNICELIVGKKWNCEVKADDLKQTPLFHAARQGLALTTSCLLQAKADPLAADDDGRTALHCAAGLPMPGFRPGLEMPQVATALIAGRAQIDASTRDGWTPAAAAAASGRVVTLEVLIGAGADFRGCLTEAATSCIQPLLRAGCKPDAPDREGISPLGVAALRGLADKVRDLCAARADVNKQDEKHGFSALHYAVLSAKGTPASDRRNLEKLLADLVARHGADVMLRDFQGKTAVDWATSIKWYSGRKQLAVYVKDRQQKEARVVEATRLAMSESMGKLLPAITSQPYEELRVQLQAVGDDAKRWGELVSAQQQESWSGVKRLVAPLLLHRAAERRQEMQPADSCRLLVEEAGFDPACGDRTTGETALFRAASAGNADACTYLVQAKCDVNGEDAGGQTALFNAARLGKLDALTTLLQARADPCHEDMNGQAPLAFAAQNGCELIFKPLVGAKALVNAPDKAGRSALFFAIRETRASAATVLLSEFNARPCRPTTSDNAGNFDIFHMAQERGLNEVVELLEVARQRQEREIKLVDLAGSGTLTEIADLMATGLEVNASGTGGLRPLHRAVARADGQAVECCRQLLEQYSADANATDKMLETPMFAAARAGSVDCVAMLLRSTSDPSLTSAGGDTALSAAVAHGHLRVATMLVEHGASAATRNARGQTPLFPAATVDIGRFLVEHKCDPCVCDNSGQTSLFNAAKNAQAELVEFLLNSAVDANLCDKQGLSALHLAKGAKVPALLLGALASVDVKDSQQGQTPLFHACSRDDFAAVGVLLRAGADGSQTDKDKKSVLLHAVRRGASLDVVSTLVRETCPSAETLDLARRYAAKSQKVKAGVLTYLEKVARRFGAVAVKKNWVKGPKNRKRYALAFEDPITGNRVPFGSVEYAAELTKLVETLPEAIPRTGWGETWKNRLTRGPPAPVVFFKT